MPPPPATPPQRLRQQSSMDYSMDYTSATPLRPMLPPRSVSSAARRARNRSMDADVSSDLRRVDWSSDVDSLLRGHAADEHDPLQREYFRLNELYTSRLSTRLTGDRDGSDRFLRLVCQAGRDGPEVNRAVELVLEDDHENNPLAAGQLQLFAQDDQTPTQSRPEWLWRLNDGVVESRIEGYAMVLDLDNTVRARKLRRGDDDKQSWTLTPQKQLQHNKTGLVLGVDGQFLVAKSAADSLTTPRASEVARPSLQWAIHRHDVQTLRVQLRAKRTSKWRDAKQRILVATVGRYERVVSLAREDSRYTARLPPEELAALNVQLESLIEDGHGLRDLLLVVQAMAEAKFEEGHVRQCVRVYMAAAQRLLREVEMDHEMGESALDEPEPEPEPEQQPVKDLDEAEQVISAEGLPVVIAYPADGSMDGPEAKDWIPEEEDGLIDHRSKKPDGVDDDDSPAGSSPNGSPSEKGGLKRTTTRASVYGIAEAGLPEYVRNLQKLQQSHAKEMAAELEKEHAAYAPITHELESSLRDALSIPVDVPLEERCSAFRLAFCGRNVEAALEVQMQMIPDLGLELQRLPRDVNTANKRDAKDIGKEFWPVFRNSFTGMPCIGANAVLRQIEPPPLFAEDEFEGGPVEFGTVDWHTARKVEFGPLPERDGRPGEMWELEWDEEGKKDWPALLRCLQQLTGQVPWHRGHARVLSGINVAGDDMDMEVDDDEDVPAEALEGEDVKAPRQMCSSAQFSFTIPPVVCERSSFLIRVRFGADTSLMGHKWTWQTDGVANAEGWVNPLTWRNGDYFSPKFRRQTEYYVRPDQTEVLPPPPVVLGKTWEAAHIISPSADDSPEREGDMRIFSILGLTPSCTANGAKVFGYGASRVEVEVMMVNGMTWDEANLEDNLWVWKLAYDVPSEPIGTVLVKTFVEAMRYRGLPAIEESLMGQVDRNRKRNIKVIREFVEESWEKLQPWYAYKVQPWLASHSLTYLFVDESRAMLLREKTRFLLQKLGVSIPEEFKRDRPRIQTVVVKSVPEGVFLLRWEDGRGVVFPTQQGRARFARGAAGRAAAPLEATIKTGQAFTIEAVALRSDLNHRESEAHARLRRLHNVINGQAEDSDYVHRRKIQLWWHVERASEMLPDEILDPQVMVGGGRLDGTPVPVQTLQRCNVKPVRVCVPVADERDELAPCFSQLSFRGVREGTMYPVHDADSEFVLQLTAIEEGAHEAHSLDVLFHIAPDVEAEEEEEEGGDASPTPRDYAESSLDGDVNEGENDESDDENDESDDEIRDDEWPPLHPGMPPDVGDMLARIPERITTMLLAFRDGLFTQLEVPQPWVRTAHTSLILNLLCA